MSWRGAIPALVTCLLGLAAGPGLALRPHRGRELMQAGTGGGSNIVNGTQPGPNGTIGIVGPRGSAGILHPQLAPLLQAIQQQRVFDDSKTAVDLPLKRSVNTTAAAAQQLLARGAPTLQALTAFVDEYFGRPGSELVECTPGDWVRGGPPNWLPNLENWTTNGTELKAFALNVYDRWRVLCRQEGSSLAGDRERSSLLPLSGELVVPGDRFREAYYWDSFWIVRGLLVSNMSATATSMVNNLLDLLDLVGHVPNGARVYYLNRSQPPLLSAMVRAVYEDTGDTRLLQRALPLLVREHAYFTRPPKGVAVQATTGNATYNLSRYFADWYAPRPESVREDTATALEGAGSSAPSNARAAALYQQLASGAESGWDYSSRWFADGQNLSTIRTTQIVPADLNAFLYQLEDNIAWAANLTGDARTSQAFNQAAAQRKAAMQALLWDAEAGTWRDGILSEATTRGAEGGGGQPAYRVTRSDATLLSNYVPLWVGLTEGDAAQGAAVTASLRRSGLIQPGGLATTLANTGQQWDFPNGWAPLQHMVIEGLNNHGGPQGKALSEQLAHSWVANVYATFNATGNLAEKYDVRTAGIIGGGGEYAPQVGFGWTNGVTLDLLSKYY